MKLNHKYIFEAQICVRRLEKFYQQVVKNKLAAQGKEHEAQL